MTLLRLLTLVALSLILACSFFIPHRLTESIDTNSEDNRLQRVELQEAKQVQALLLKHGSADGAAEPVGLGIDGLKVSLIEKLLDDSWPQGILNVKYEFQRGASDTLSYANYPLESFRVVVSFSARHSIAMLRYLDILMLSVYPHPVEIRACEINKVASSGLRNQCVLDFHYWSSPDER